MSAYPARSVADHVRMCKVNLVAYAARGRGPAPDTPARGIRPLEPRFDVLTEEVLGAHAYEQI